jgi:ribosomal protein S18 acetylase RimI-like enzyme
MFRISHVIGTHREHDRRCLEEIQALLTSAFPDFADEPHYIARKLEEQAARGNPCILLAAHGPGDRIIGFALADYFESIGYAYLDYIVTQAEQRGRGLGGALYEALLEDLTARGARGLFSRSPPTTRRRSRTRPT